MRVMFHRWSRARYETINAASIILQFGIPVGISIAFGFARLTNLHETLAAAFLCTVMACLSWAAGRAIRIG